MKQITTEEFEAWKEEQIAYINEHQPPRPREELEEIYKEHEKALRKAGILIN